MKLFNLYKTLRANDWWNNILPPIIAFYFLGKLNVVDYSVDLVELFFLFFLMIGIAIFGFSLGEWTDIQDDVSVGKKNQLANKSIVFKISLLLFSLCTVALSVYMLKLKGLHLALVITQLVCFFIYSVPPIRLKRFIFSSLILDATYSGTLMYVLAFSLSQTLMLETFIIGIAVWGFAKGARNYLLHTLNDAENDRKLGVKSFGNTINRDKNLNIIRLVILPIEILSLIYIFSLVEVHPVKLVLAYLVVLTFASYHKSTSNQLGKFNFLANVNIFHEVAFLMIVTVLFSFNNKLAYTLVFGFAIVFPAIGWWLISGLKKIFSKSSYSKLL